MMLERLMTAITAGVSTGITTWKNGPVPAEWDAQQILYLERWAGYTGTLFEELAKSVDAMANPAIYANTKLMWKHDEAMVDFYAGVIYQGSLPTDGKPLPDDIPNAIPFDPQTGKTTANENLLKAVAELCSAWNWQQQMSLRPMYGAALGDVLTELVDDSDRRFVYPQVVWPGYVKDIELDYVGNVRAYTLEYQVQDEDETYKYTKTVDGEWFRYFKNDKPFVYPKVGFSEVANPYGFVPAIWDRHRIAAPGAVRGKAATDGTRQARYQLNSLFSHSLDFQHKAFWVPFMMAGDGGARGGDKQIDLGAPPSGKTLAELFKWIRVPKDSTLLQPSFDVGKTLEMIKEIREGILAENPEASFYQQMREMQQVTAPGAERLMGDVKNRVDLARAGYDAGTVKLFQMAIAMCGFRSQDTSDKGWSRRGFTLNRRRLAFVEYDLLSFDRGELDMGILPRPIVNPTEQERMETELLKVQVITAKEGVMTKEGLKEIYPDLKEEAFNALVAERKARDTGMLLEDYAPREGEDREVA